MLTRSLSYGTISQFMGLLAAPLKSEEIAMRFRSNLLVAAVSCVLSAGVAFAGANPIPGVGVVIKRNPGSGGYAVVPGGFFGPGSEPFTGFVPMEGRCSHECGGCDNDCAGREGDPDGRIDYEADFATGPFTMIMQPTVMHSIAPILVRINGVDSFFDVFVTISGQGPSSDDPIPGMLHLPPGESLDTGTSSVVLGSSLDLHCTFTFFDHSTGMAAGSALEQDFHMTLDNAALPITRVADGTPGGRIVLGLSGSGVVPFQYSSADGLVMTMLSLYDSGAVTVQESPWGWVKA